MIEVLSERYRAFAFLRRQRRLGFLSVGVNPLRGGTWKDDAVQSLRLYEAFGCRENWEERKQTPFGLRDIIGIFFALILIAAQALVLAGILLLVGRWLVSFAG